MNIEPYRYLPPAPAVVWAETLLGTALVPAVGAVFHRPDVMFLTSDFPALIFAPLLFGIRYGFAQGFASALLTTLAMLAQARLAPQATGGNLLPYVFTVVLIGMITGQLTDGWLRRLGNLQLSNDQIQLRLTEFVRSYQLLKVSHDQLEERLAGDVYNVRAAVTALRRRCAGMAHGRLLAGHGGELLAFLSAYSQIQQASLYAVSATRRIAATPLASVGADVACAPDHPMLIACLARGMLVSLRDDDGDLAERHARQKLLAVLPLEDARGRIWAVVAIASMPFIAYHSRNLTMLAVLGAALGDLVYRSERDAGADGAHHAAGEFRDELALWLHYARRYRVPSTLVGVWLAPAISADASARRADHWLFEQARGLDLGQLHANAQGGHSLLMLMPMTNLQGAHGYQERVQLLLEERLGRGLDESLIRFHVHAVDGRGEAETLLAGLRRECAVVDP